jgi:DNA-binding response OmpR family regulator
MSRRILIVEDEVLIAFEISSSLEDMGFEIIGPSVHLDDGFRKATTENIDIAVLDVNLGKGKTSEPIAKVLRARNVPFLFITAYDRDQIQFITDGDLVLTKPLSRVELADALDKILHSKSE